jgi:hypothetical protein
MVFLEFLAQRYDKTSVCPNISSFSKAKFVTNEKFLYLCHHIQTKDIVYDEQKDLYYIIVCVLLCSLQPSCREQDGHSAAQDDQFRSCQGKKPWQGVVRAKEYYCFGDT